MKRSIDLSATVNDAPLSPPSTNMPLEITPHRRGPGFWQVSSVRQSLHTGAHIDSPLHVFKDGMTTAEISLEDRKSTRLNSSHLVISYAVFCLKKKNEDVPASDTRR